MKGYNKDPENEFYDKRFVFDQIELDSTSTSEIFLKT